MRFLSPISNYRLVTLHQKVEVLADGSNRVLAEGHTAEFRQFEVTPWEYEEARKRFKFRGTAMNIDGSPRDPIDRVSSFDTASIHDPSLRKQVEAFMSDPQRSPDYGNVNDGYMLVSKPVVPAPWPTYDDLTIHGRRSAEHVAAKNLEIAAATGIPISTLLDYERQSEDRREDVIAAYEVAVAAPDAEQPELVEA